MQTPEAKKVDRFGNELPFKALTKEQDCPKDIIGGGLLLKKKDGDKEITLQLDVLHIQRGRDEKTSSKGWKYQGKRINKDNVHEFWAFYGDEYVAAKLDTVYNTENQKLCSDSVNEDGTNKWTDEELLVSLRDRTTRGDGNNTIVKEIKGLTEELKALKEGTPEYIAKLTEIAMAGMKLATK